MLKLSILRVIIFIVGFVLFIVSEDMFSRERELIRSKLAKYILSMLLILSAFGIALFQHTTFLPFHIFFYVAFIASNVLTVLCNYYAPPYKCCGRILRHYIGKNSIKLVRFSTYVDWAFIAGSLAFLFISFSGLSDIPTETVRSYDVDVVVDFNELESLDYESIYLVSKSNQSYATSNSDMSFSLDELAKDENTNCIKRIDVTTYKEIDKSQKKEYELYNWLFKANSSVETFYMLCE